jgi:alpha-ketoglutarate-dependent taurine dioxygenase
MTDNKLNEKKNSLNRVWAAPRRAAKVSESDLVKIEQLEQTSLLPLLIQPAVGDVNLIEWASARKDLIETHLLRHGGILFRGFKMRTAAELEEFIKMLCNELIEYRYASTPRSQESGHIYTSTEYPADQTIPLHNEMSYSTSWPMRIFFFCITPAGQGGETPIADSRKVFERIPSRIRQPFMEKQVLYVRNYGEGFDLSWQNAFQTEDKSEVEQFCRKMGIECEWKSENRLRTRQLCQAVATHPKTGETVWFNQAHLFHVSGLEPAVRESLLKEFGHDDLPRNAYYGDGTPIDDAVLDEIREIYQREAITFSWQQGDVMMLDNILAAHGRHPFTGSRKILVGMAQPFVGHASGGLK